jgi:hypothetical protein
MKVINCKNIGNLCGESISIKKVWSSKHIVLEIHISSSNNIWIFDSFDLIIVIPFTIFNNRNITKIGQIIHLVRISKSFD